MLSGGNINSLGCVLPRLYKSGPFQSSCGQSRDKERHRNVLFNDARNTFYLRLYGVTHMLEDHSDSKRGNPLPPHRLHIWVTGWNEK